MTQCKCPPILDYYDIPQSVKAVLTEEIIDDIINWIDVLKQNASLDTLNALKNHIDDFMVQVEEGL